MSKKSSNKTFQRNVISGRLASDPRFKFTSKGKAICNFGLVVNDDLTNDSDYIPCVAWDEEAKLINDNAKKGSLILIEGKIKSSKYMVDNLPQYDFKFEISSAMGSKLLFLDNKPVVEKENMQGNE